MTASVRRRAEAPNTLQPAERGRTIPVYTPDLTGNESAYVMECLDTTWISSRGSFIGRFESGFAAYIDSRFASAVSNGTVALHAALLALGIGAGDEVIVPTLTYIASVNAITYTGATPVFVDSLPGTWQMDPADVARTITGKTRAIMAVHLYGHPVDLDPLTALCDARGIALVEDCAEAIGTLYKGRHVGTFGAIGTFSFFGNKTITTGEGGMIVSNDEAHNTLVNRIKGQGLAKDREYWHDIVGYNYRMTNICAAIGVAQLERIDAIVERKIALAALYRAMLAGLPLAFQDDDDAAIRHSYWMVSVVTGTPEDRDPLRQWLKADGIETRPFFAPVHRMPMYAGAGGAFPVADDLSCRGINLPSSPSLTIDDVDRIARRIRAFYA